MRTAAAGSPASPSSTTSAFVGGLTGFLVVFHSRSTSSASAALTNALARAGLRVQLTQVDAELRNLAEQRRGVVPCRLCSRRSPAGTKSAAVLRLNCPPSSAGDPSGLLTSEYACGAFGRVGSSARRGAHHSAQRLCLSFGNEDTRAVPGLFAQHFINRAGASRPERERLARDRRTAVRAQHAVALYDAARFPRARAPTKTNSGCQAPEP